MSIRRAWARVGAVSLCAFAGVSHATPPAAQAHRPPWKAEGEVFLGYGVFRDEMVANMRLARKRLAIVTPLLTDGDVATALFAARVRGLETLALLDARESRAYNSRHGYLARTQVPTWLVTLAKFRTDAVSLVVVDDTAWRVTVRFDDASFPSGKDAASAIKVEASSLAPEEIFGWKDVKGARFATDTPRNPPSAGAKKPTSRSEPGLASSVTMGENDAKKQSGSRIPRRLPRETRLQRLRRQAPEPLSPGSTEESTGSLKVPVPPPNETDVSEE